MTRSCVWFFLVVFCELIAKFLIEMEGMTLAMQNGNLYLHLFFQRAVVFHQQLTRFAASNKKKLFAVLYKTISDRLRKSIDSNNGH